MSLIEELRKYIMDNHTTGLKWNANVRCVVFLSKFMSALRLTVQLGVYAQGVMVDEYLANLPSATGGPPPPPPPPMAPPVPAPPVPAAAAGGVAAVFAELNRGEEVTKGLRKVDKSQMTHKNPALRASSVVPSTTGSAGE